MEIIKGSKVKHIKTEVVETIVDVCKVKINGEWTDGVVYTGEDRYTGKPMVFVRTLEEFIREFEEYNNN